MDAFRIALSRFMDWLAHPIVKLRIQYYVRDVRGQGRICYRAIGKTRDQTHDALELYHEKKLLRRFSKADAEYIKRVALLETSLNNISFPKADGKNDRFS